MEVRETKWLLVGGGLANAFMALYLNRLGEDFILLESSHSICAGKTWSYHLSDLSRSAQHLLEGVKKYSWQSYRVEFPLYSRDFSSVYQSIESENLAQFLVDQMPNKILTKQRIQKEDEKKITTQEFMIHFTHRVDAKSFNYVWPRGTTGFQKFVGLIIQTQKPHGLRQPVLMDVTIRQKGGFRFFYSLPFSDHELLVEDTRYTLDGFIDENEFLTEIKAYLEKKFSIDEYTILRIEKASLPIPLFQTPFLQKLEKNQSSVVNIGFAAGFFNPTTGYSVPYAARTAEFLVQRVLHEGQNIDQAIKEYSTMVFKRNRFFYLLNRMLFLAARPERCYIIFQRFYRLPSGLIHRFYAGELKLFDKVRILFGKPPVPIWAALRAILTRWPREQK